MAWFVNDAILLLRYSEWLRVVWGKKTNHTTTKKNPKKQLKNPTQSWILKSSIRIPMCMFAKSVVCFHSRKLISEKFEACVWGGSRSLFFQFLLWTCYIVYRLLVVLQYSIAVPPPPINIVQLVHDEAQYTDGFYLPKLPNCLFKRVSDK